MIDIINNTPAIIIKPFTAAYVPNRPTQPRPETLGIAAVWESGKFQQYTYRWILWDGPGSFCGFAQVDNLGVSYTPTNEELAKFFVSCSDPAMCLEVAKAYTNRAIPAKGLEAIKKAISAIKAEKTANARAQNRKEWATSLPRHIGEFEINGFDVLDKYGNFLFSLPQKPVDNIENWLNAELSAFCEM